MKRGRKRVNFINEEKTDNDNIKIKIEDSEVFVELKETDLNKFDEDEFDAYVKNLSKFKKIDEIENERLRKIRRRIKNKHYARTSRSRKEILLHNLTKIHESQYESLKKSLQAIETKQSYLECELNRLKDELKFEECFKPRLDLKLISNEISHLEDVFEHYYKLDNIPFGKIDF